MVDSAQNANQRTTFDWADGNDPTRLPEEVRHAFPELDGEILIRDLSGGLLHRSFHLRLGNNDFVLQKVSDVFAAEIHDNIQKVTRHLSAHGLTCPRLLATRDGEPSFLASDGGRWRLMPHLGGVSMRTIQSNAQAHSAGELVGRFHAALTDFSEPLAPIGIPYRDTPHYLASLRHALVAHSGHRLGPEMQHLGRRILEELDARPADPNLPERVIHGDLKLENLLFADVDPPGRDVAFALVDFDTLMRAPLWADLGDAWRSWCNPAAEDAEEVRFDTEIFESSLVGFLDGCGGAFASSAERDSLVDAPERMSLELCARFVTDALEESYFDWDATRFRSRGDHNASRANLQWRLYESMQDSRDERASILRRLT